MSTARRLQRIAVPEAADLRSLAANSARLFLLDRGGYEERARIHVLRRQGQARQAEAAEAAQWWDPGESSADEQGKRERRMEYAGGEPIYSEASETEDEGELD